MQRFNVLACGRRFGKDVYQMNKLVETALAGYPAAWAAPTYKTLTENWRAVSQLVAPITARRDSQEHRLELLTGGVIDMWSMDNPDTIRGRKYKRFVINEAGFVPNLMESWGFVIRPTLVDLTGDAFFGGTPKGQNGFWQMYQNGQDTEQPDWASWQLSSYENPFIPKRELDDMARALPERIYQQEIMAAFLEDAGGVFRNVMACATATKGAALPGDFVFGVDWGKQNDFTVIAVVDRKAKALVDLDRFNRIDYTLQVGRLKALAGKYKPGIVIAERNSMGEPLCEQLHREGLPVRPFTTSNATKANAIDALALAFERGEIQILPDATLVAELQAYEAERLPSGLLRYGAPEGMHDDTVMALALAWHGVASKGVFVG